MITENMEEGFLVINSKTDLLILSMKNWVINTSMYMTEVR